MAGLARGETWPREQPLSLGSAGHCDSEDSASRERQHTCPEILNGRLRDTKGACDTSVGRDSVTLLYAAM